MKNSRNACRKIFKQITLMADFQVTIFQIKEIYDLLRVISLQIVMLTLKCETFQSR